MRICGRVKRGMVFWFDPVEAYGQTNLFNTPEGIQVHSSIQNFKRPVLVISNDEANFSLSTCTIVPLTTSKKPEEKWRFSFKSQEGITTTVLFDQIRTIDIEALGDYYFSLSDEIMKEIDKCIMSLFCSRSAPTIEWSSEYNFLNSNNTGHSLEQNIEQVQNKVVNSKFVKPVTGSQIEKFNARYGITPVKAKKLVWNEQMCKEFIDYVSNNSTEEVMKKYSLPNKKSVYSKTYYCKKVLEKLKIS